MACVVVLGDQIVALKEVIKNPFVYTAAATF
jgi:hypothetical protein